MTDPKPSKLHLLVREPALIIGLVTAAFGVAVLFGLEVTTEQTAGVVTLVGAIVALLRFLTTPSSEVVAQVKPSGEVVHGQASQAETGSLVSWNPGGAIVVPVDPDAP